MITNQLCRTSRSSRHHIPGNHLPRLASMFCSSKPIGACALPAPPWLGSIALYDIYEAKTQSNPRVCEARSSLGAFNLPGSVDWAEFPPDRWSTTADRQKSSRKPATPPWPLWQFHSLGGRGNFPLWSALWRVKSTERPVSCRHLVSGIEKRTWQRVKIGAVSRHVGQTNYRTALAGNLCLLRDKAARVHVIIKNSVTSNKWRQRTVASATTGNSSDSYYSFNVCHETSAQPQARYPGILDLICLSRLEDKQSGKPKVIRLDSSLQCFCASKNKIVAYEAM